MKFKFNWIGFRFKFNWRKTGWKLVHKLLKICSSLSSCVTMVLKKQIGSKKHESFNFMKSIFYIKIYFGRAKPIGLYSCFFYTKFDVIVIIGIFENKILWQLCNWMWIKSHHGNARTWLGYWSIVLGLFWVIWNIWFQEVYVKAQYGGQKMLSQILFFEIMQLSISTKPILKDVFINYIQNKVVQ